MDTRRPDLNLLATLEVLIEEKNVTRAAARLHLSQPAVSAQLSRLRELFNDQLLVPARHGMTPTAKALELSGPLRLALDQVLKTLGHSRKVVLSAASFLIVPEIVAGSDFVALVPQRLVAGRTDLKVVPSPIASAGSPSAWCGMSAITGTAHIVGCAI